MDLSLNVVCDLFLPGTNLWNEELLDLNFYPWEAEAIKNIHVSQIEAADALIWPHMSDGVYSVCIQSGARIAYWQQHSIRISLACRMWRLERVYGMAFGTVCESLPTKFNLHRHQVLSFGICDACGDCAKDGIHSLWFCDVVKPIWMSDARFSFLCAHQFSNFGDLFQFLCLRGSSNMISLFAMVAWGIWER